MGIKRIVDTSFWTDGKVDEFSPEDKYFMLYLLTNPFSSQLGIYEISIRQVAFQLGYSIETVKVLLDRFENKYGIIIFAPETNEVAIKNFLYHSIVKGGAPVRDCLIKEMKAVKSKHLIAEVFCHLQKKPTYEETANSTVKNLIAAFWKSGCDIPYCNERKDDMTEDPERHVNVSYHNENENENENENDNDNENVINHYAEIISYLNEKAGTKFKASTAKTKSAIHARLSEGFTIDDFKEVIDKKCVEWLNDEKMAKYLRPETLFGTKFEGYLNAKASPNGNQQRGYYRQTKAEELNSAWSMMANWAENGVGETV